jgi:hypothetical protein
MPLSVEAIDMAACRELGAGSSRLDIEGPRWQYDVYISPSREAA